MKIKLNERQTEALIEYVDDALMRIPGDFRVCTTFRDYAVWENSQWIVGQVLKEHLLGFEFEVEEDDND